MKLAGGRIPKEGRVMVRLLGGESEMHIILNHYHDHCL